MPLDRSYPHGDQVYAALEQDRFPRLFDSSQKVAVYWLTAADTVTVVGYYDTVSAANAAALANKSGQKYPRVLVNWGHPDIEKRGGGVLQTPDAREDLPSWYDEDPTY